MACVRAFVVVHAEGQFARAARVLGIGPSALSKRIRRLEEQLDVELVERDTTGVLAFTAAGFRFLPHARRLLDDEARARRSVAAEPGPVFRLGVPGRVGDHPDHAALAKLARELRRDSPDAILRCYGVPFARLTDSLLNDTVHVLWDSSTLDHAGIESTPLNDFERIGVVSKGHPWAEAGEIDVDVFAGHPMIYDPEVATSWMSRWYLDDVRPASAAKLVGMTADDATGVMRVLAASEGVTVAQQSMSHRLGPDLRPVTLIGVPPTTSYASSRRGDNREAVMRLLAAMRTTASA